MSHRFVGQSGPAWPVTFKNPEFLFSYASVAGLSGLWKEAGSQAGSQAPNRAPSDTEFYWAKVDGAYKRVLAFFESPDRDLISADYELLAGLTEFYGDMLAYHTAWGKYCEGEGLYNGFLALSAEVFAEAFRILADNRTGKIIAYAGLLEDLAKVFETVKQYCFKLHSKVTSATGG